MKRSLHLKYISFLLVQASVWMSCSSDLVLEAELLSDTPIRLAASVENVMPTRSTPNTDIQNHAFDPNEHISVYINTAETTPKIVGVAPITCTTSAAENYVNTLTPDYQAYYPTSKPVNIYAVYPSSVTSGSDGTTIFTVDAEQTEATYKANDLMHALLSNQPKSEQPVQLQFTHKMAKFIISVDVEDELEISSIKLKNFNRSVVFTPSTGATGTLSNASDITIENGGAALVPPQSITNAAFIEVETTLGKTETQDGRKATFTTTKTFEEGKEYVVALKVGRVNLGLTANIVDWVQDGARQVIEQTTSDGYTIEYTQSLPFEESFRNTPYEQPNLKITETATGNELTRYTDSETNYDYSIIFFGNDQAGTATMVINGNPDKTDTRGLSWVKTFTITQGTGSLSYPAYSSATSYGYTYEGAKLKVPYVSGGTVNWPCTKVCDPDAETYVSTNTSVATVSSSGNVVMVGVGETTIMVSSPSDGNYTAASTSYNLEVTKRTSTGLTIVLTESGNAVTDDTYTYNGLPITPTVTVYDGAVAEENQLSVGVDYTVGFSNNLNAGTATVTVTGAGDYDGTATQTFKINPITTTFNESYDDVNMSINSSLTRYTTINHRFGTVSYTSSNSSIAAISSTGVITTGNTTGTATITVSVAEPSPKNYTSATMTYTVTVESYNAEYSYNSNKTPYTFECKKSGTYLLEVWGASGYSPSTNYTGGKGAYVAGTVHLEKDQKLYVYVGGKGGASGEGGWNGGGSCTNSSKNENCAGGGGATDISICNGDWNSDTHLGSRIIVAGGGGGALYIYATMVLDARYANGGYGGAWNGQAGRGVNAYGGGGTRSRAGSSGRGNTIAAGFGYGGNYSGSDIVGCGGGGWYGGGSGGDNSRHGAGGGGSSYMWNSSNSTYYTNHGTNNAPTTTGSLETDATKFYVTEIGKSAASNDGNGKAKITFVE